MPSSTTDSTNPSRAPTNDECGIKEVWASNLDDEFREMRKIIKRYPFVAMDTEFPGVVARPIGEFRSSWDFQYQLLRCNVGLLKLIQCGFTFFNQSGELASPYSTWQFNFKFNLAEDMYAQDSIELLQKSGLIFKRHEEDGIDVLDFAELLTVSGLVLCENVTWISFHSGYDFGYLLKVLVNTPLPTEEVEFFDLLRTFFPSVYDVKFMMRSCKNLKGGLQEVADELDIERIGPQHQAGSDSLLTGQTFFKLRSEFFDDKLELKNQCGHLFGLGTTYSSSSSGQQQSSSNLTFDSAPDLLSLLPGGSNGSPTKFSQRVPMVVNAQGKGSSAASLGARLVEEEKSEEEREEVKFTL